MEMLASSTSGARNDTSTGPWDIVEASDIKKMRSKVVLACSATTLKELVDIRPGPGSCFILSMSEPFTEEQEFERVVN